MTNWILKLENFNNLLKKIEDGKGGCPFEDVKIEKYYPVSEIVLGNSKGFGSPDGILILKESNSKIIIFIDAKFNATYDESCKKDKGNSKICMQFRLKKNFINAIKGLKDKEIDRIEKNGKALQLKEGIDVFCRQYIINNEREVKEFFLAITKDENNPFKGKNDIPKNYCWISKNKLLELLNLKK